MKHGKKKPNLQCQIIKPNLRVSERLRQETNVSKLHTNRFLELCKFLRVSKYDSVKLYLKVAA